MKGTKSKKNLELNARVLLVNGLSERNYYQDENSCNLRVPPFLLFLAPPFLEYQKQIVQSSLLSDCRESRLLANISRQ